jgi:predicted small secreted protein
MGAWSPHTGGTWIAKMELGGESHHYFNYSEGTAMFRKLIYCFAALATALALSACNTMTGVGKDVEKGGAKIQEESKEVQRKL